MKRRDFLCGATCLIAGFAFSEFLNFKNNIVKHEDKKNNKIIERMELGGFTVGTSSHCNLNCKGCDVYSPLAKEEFVTFEQFDKDLTRLKELAPDRNIGCGFLGGEPLLNKDLPRMLRRRYELYPENSSNILSNGILLNEMPEDFWKALQETNTEICVTKYPINIDFSKAKKYAKKYGIDIKFEKLKSK